MKRFNSILLLKGNLFYRNNIKKKRIEKFLDWLKKYKIIFEIFQIVFIGFFGFLITLYTYNINKTEQEIHKKELEPYIIVKSIFFNPDTLNHFTTQSIQIINDGKQLRNFKYKIYSYYKTSVSCSRCSIKKYIYIPIDNYYKDDSVSNNSTNLILENFTPNNFATFVRFFDECKENWQANKTTFGPFGLFLIAMEYNDITGEHYKKYFKIENEDYFYFNPKSLPECKEINEEDFTEIRKFGTLISNNTSYSKEWINYKFLDNIYKLKLDSIVNFEH